MAFGYREATTEELNSPLILPGEDLSLDQRAFLNAFISCGTIRGAAKRSRIHAFYHYQWRRENLNYDYAYSQSLQLIADQLAETARTRGKDGYDYEVLGKDGEIVKLKRFSDNLLMFALKGLPGGQNYRENFKVEINNDNRSINLSTEQFNFDHYRKLLAVDSNPDSTQSNTPKPSDSE